MESSMWGVAGTSSDFSCDSVDVASKPDFFFLSESE